ncbi:MAG: response regulator transcription factor [Prevotella sp.]|nr:response regulator transcription factor [Prevotella sp.]
MKIIAIDDEPLALSIIQMFCQRLTGVQLQTFTDPDAGMAAVIAQQPDLLLLDIRLGTADGISLSHHLPASTSLVFTTAYTEYALVGFEVGAVDYLHKPFSFERFVNAIERVSQRRLPPASITLKANYQSVIIPIADIVYIEAMDNYVRIHLTESRHQTSKTTLTSLLSQLPADQFIRIHKSFVVSRSHISRYTIQQVYVQGLERPLPVGRTYADVVRQWTARL